MLLILIKEECVRIAIVDDEQTVRMVAQVQLKLIEGALQPEDEVIVYSDPESFLKAFTENPKDYFSIAVIDHDLGEGKLSGYDLMNIMFKENFSGVSVLFTSTESQLSEEKATLNQGVYFVNKINIENPKVPYEQLAKLLQKARNRE